MTSSDFYTQMLFWLSWFRWIKPGFKDSLLEIILCFPDYFSGQSSLFTVYTICLVISILLIVVQLKKTGAPEVRCLNYNVCLVSESCCYVRPRLFPRWKLPLCCLRHLFTYILSVPFCHLSILPATTRIAWSPRQMCVILGPKSLIRMHLPCHYSVATCNNGCRRHYVCSNG